MPLEVRTYWLSFADQRGSLGVAVIDVTELHARRARERRPGLSDEGSWLLAATRLAWDHDVNPGGSIKFTRIDDWPADELARVPRLELMDRARLRALGLAD